MYILNYQEKLGMKSYIGSCFVGFNIPHHVCFYNYFKLSQNSLTQLHLHCTYFLLRHKNLHNSQCAAHLNGLC